MQGDATFPIRAEDLGRVLTQLLRNAAEHGASVVTIEVSKGQIAITDNGAGIDHADTARIFDPFFTTRRDHGGTGMGLTIASSLVEAAGGRIDLDQNAQNTRFLISF